MKVTKKRKFIVVYQHLLNQAIIARKGGEYDRLITQNTLGVNIWECNTREAIHNLKILQNRGLNVLKYQW
jgi:hypothetical protein